MSFTRTAVAATGALSLSVECTVEDPILRSDAAIGWQIFDPETGLFMSEGEWLPAGKQMQLKIELPDHPGVYRIYVSPMVPDSGWAYQRGGRFLVVDARVGAAAAAEILRSEMTTLTRLNWQGLPAALRRSLIEPFQTITSNLSLIDSLVRRDILARYRGSFGDVLWTFLNPILLMATYFFVFGVVLQSRFPGDPSRSGYALYFLCGMLPWLSFSEPVNRAAFAILENRNFVKKLVFPVEIIPVNHVISGFIMSLFASVVFLVVLLLSRGGIPLTIFWLPVVIVPQLLFTLGLCWMLSSFGVFARDLGQISGFLMTLWFFLTPICYPESSLPGGAVEILRLNPLYVLVHGYRRTLLEAQAPEFWPTAKLYLLSIFVFWLGYGLFRKLRRNFADVI
jgi:lipopolysaccharide transport system permease protein